MTKETIREVSIKCFFKKKFIKFIIINDINKKQVFFQRKVFIIMQIFYLKCR